MWRYLFLAFVLAGAATQIPVLMQDSLDDRAPGDEVRENERLALAESEESHHNPLAGRIAEIEADRRGHFVAKARINGRPVDVLVDTGATAVAINESTARKIGIRLKPSDFRHEIRTANGTTLAASAVIDEIQIGRVIVSDVRAIVARDESLSSALLGMSFLKRLRKFEVDSGRLVLRQ